jgi:hypothetical protein
VKLGNWCIYTLGQIKAAVKMLWFDIIKGVEIKGFGEWPRNFVNPQVKDLFRAKYGKGIS